MSMKNKSNFFGSTMKYYMVLLAFFIFTGCNPDTLLDEPEYIEDTKKHYIDVFTLAPVKNVLLQDAQNQVALYDDEKKSYYFKESISYPINATALSKTYIDVDYDEKSTSSDLAPSTLFSSSKLQSFCSSVNFLTSYYYDQNLSDNNITLESYKAEIKTRFDIDICEDTLTSKNNAITLFGTYNAVVKNKSFTSLNDVEAEVTKVEDFFSSYLLNISSSNEQIKYYSFYNALVELDKGNVSRADTGHKPAIPTRLKAKTSLVKYNSKVDVFDIVKQNDTLFLAAGHDELAKVTPELESVVFSTDVSLLSFGSRLDFHEYKGAECLFLANAKVGVSAFTLNTTEFKKEVNTLARYYNDKKEFTLFTQHSVTNVNSYISLNQNKRLLGISTSDLGYYLLNIKDNFNGCIRSREFEASKDFIIDEQSGAVIDATFRDDGTYLYVAHKDAGVYGYKTDILDKVETMGSQKIFALKDTQEAYNMKLYNNDNELFVTTDKGVLIYDVGSSRDRLSYVSEYLSEGAQKDYYPAIDSFEDYIFITDGYKGIKVLKLNNSFHPMLCGVEYFAPDNNDYELAKTISVKYDDGYLYVGVTSQGIAKLKLEDLLFRHCQ